MWLRGMTTLSVSWHTTITWRWLNVPLPTSCPLRRTLNPGRGVGVCMCGCVHVFVKCLRCKYVCVRVCMCEMSACVWDVCMCVRCVSMIQILDCGTCHILVYSHFTQKTPLLTDLCGGVFQWQEPQPWTSQCPSPPLAFSTSPGCGSDSIVCLHSVQMINQSFNQPIREPAIQS